GTAGTNGWYRSAVQVALNPFDNASGVQAMFYKIDGGALLTYTTPFTVSTAGMHTVNFWSVDVAGNTEAQQTLTVKIDSSTPVITESVSPTQAGHGNKPLTVKISGTVTDTPSGVLTNGSVSYSVLDEYGVTQPSGGVTLQSNGTYSFTLSLPATKNPGDNNGHLYTITIQAVDQAGNVATASATVKIT
ncbi:MAG TPA: hypothetical protein VHP99_00745, partial [Pyrinomonadaceae bacterium]|nr:hypothetical protein [Pyrinomonadaceae bacterium]